MVAGLQNLSVPPLHPTPLGLHQRGSSRKRIMFRKDDRANKSQAGRAKKQ